jgi:hypothetical protein
VLRVAGGTEIEVDQDMKNVVRPLLVAILSLTTATAVFAQDKKSEEKNEVAKAINEKNYVFRANTALPLRGRTIQLTSDYTLTVKNDSVIAYLPYFGRAYTAPLDPTKSALDFTSTDFGYKADQNKKGNWQIEIKPKDAGDVRQLFLSISEEGYGSLQVTSNNRQSITFNGYIVKK